MGFVITLLSLIGLFDNNFMLDHFVRIERIHFYKINDSKRFEILRLLNLFIKQFKAGFLYLKYPGSYDVPEEEGSRS